MANQKHLDILKQGVDVWNKWRESSEEKPDLSKADLSNANLSGANLSGAGLSGVNLSGADLRRADLGKANLRDDNLPGAILSGADLSEANLSGADLNNCNLKGSLLSMADLSKANLSEADLSEADVCYANLSRASLFAVRLLGTNLKGANLSDCLIHGISAWNIKLNQDTIQTNLIITPFLEPVITVDNLKVAQFIYLLLNNEEIRDVIDTISRKVVLILGRFTDERKEILDAIREELRKYNYLPVMFDFQKPSTRGTTETVSILAHMALFVIADITDAKSIPQELQRIVPDLPSVPVQPLLQSEENEYGMFEDFKRYPWVLELHYYKDLADLKISLKEKIIIPVENWLSKNR